MRLKHNPVKVYKIFYYQKILTIGILPNRNKTKFTNIIKD